MLPSSPLASGLKYTVYLTSGVQSSSGVAVSALSWSFTTSGISAPVGTATKPLVKINGKYVVFTDVFPYISNGRTMIPFRSLFEAMSASIDYNAPTKKITAKLGSNSVVLFIGKWVAYKNGTAITLETPPVALQSRVMIPLRFAGEALGGTVKWDPVTFTVNITTK